MCDDGLMWKMFLRYLHQLLAVYSKFLSRRMEEKFRLNYLGHVGGCGVTDEVAQWMNNVQSSAVEGDDDGGDGELPPSPQDEKPAFPNAKEYNAYPKSSQDEPHRKYTKEMNSGGHDRQKRATRRDENKNTCSLYIQTDPLIWKHIREGFPEVRGLINCFKNICANDFQRNAFERSPNRGRQRVTIFW